MSWSYKIVRNLTLLLVLMALVDVNYAQTSADAGIRSYQAGYSHSLKSNGFTSEPGFQVSRIRGLPIFFKRLARKNGLPLFYTNFGFQYLTTGVKANRSSTIATGEHKYRFHAFQVPLEIEYKLFSMRGGGQIKSLYYSLFSAYAGINIGYQTGRFASSNEEVFPVAGMKASPFQTTFSIGLKGYKNMHGFSLNISYNRDLIPTTNTDDYQRCYFVVGIAWNRLDSECKTARRRFGQMFKEISGGK
jgi:hypothetical protein